MNIKPSFSFKIVGKVLEVKIQGVWTIQADLAYLSEFGEQIQKMRGNSWAIVVDMRGRILPAKLFDSEFISKIILDRRNQKAECWIVDHLKQGEELLPFFRESNVIPERFLDVELAEKWLAEQGFEYSHSPGTKAIHAV
jgi:hypothetical protein